MLTYQSTSVLDIEMRRSPERILCTHMCERQAGTRSMHIQYSYNNNVSILLVSLLSRASGSLSTTPFLEMFLHLFVLFFHNHCDEELQLAQSSSQQKHTES